MSKPTPGPWFVTSGLTVYALHGEPARNRFSAYVQAGRRDDASADELAANARLIAAAPDLAFHLLAAANYIDALGGDSRSYRQAIARATGAAQ